MTLLALLPLAIWLYLLLAHGQFWLARERDTAPPPAPATWPSVVAVVPARDEADVIARSIGSLAAQAYPGDFRIVLVDDGSSDCTGDIARAIGSARVTVIDGTPLPPGWTGKLWAVEQGIAAAQAPRYLWLTDADIAHAPDTLASLVARAERSELVLTSLMAKLRCDTLAERALVPAFVFFFQLLYPFARVNRPAGIGAAAGGCMLVRADALARAGGIGAVRGALIDDCAVGALMKRQGRIWLGLTDRSVSIRPYESWGSVAAMIARSAYAQLRYSPLLLAGTALGLAITYLLAPGIALFGHGLARGMGIATWALIALSFQPMLRFYRQSQLWGIALPAIAAFYGGCTLLSAWQHFQGTRRHVEGTRTSGGWALMATIVAADTLASGKGHRDENFPVASVLLKPAHRAPIMAFYRFARAADDIADHPTASRDEKHARLAAMRTGLDGPGAPEAMALAAVMAERGLDPVHARDLLVAFETDVDKNRYKDWDDLIGYCRHSAMPVGRYVLDVHGEDRATWPASDALCAALQIVNHLQDCGKDYRAIDRVYIPTDALAEHGARIEDLSAARSPPALRATILALAQRTRGLLADAAPFAAMIRDRRLAAEVAVIHALAESLRTRLERRDPLAERVHHGKLEAGAIALRAALPILLRRRR